MLILFFLSGAAGLAHQVAWAKRIGLFLGQDIVGVSIVLMAFMLGFALGGKFAGRWADRSARPGLLYAKLEIGIALFALAIPWIFDALESLYPVLYRATENSQTLRNSIRALLALGALLVPTILMGATFPVMGRMLKDNSSPARTAAIFYSSNTLGAAAGALLGGFFLLPQFGLLGAIRIAAAGNALAGIAAAIFFRAESKSTPAPPARERPAAPRINDFRNLLAAVFLSGLAALGIESLLTRNLALHIGGTAYSFALILAIFLLAIGAGALFFPKTADDPKKARDLFALSQLAAAGLALLGPQALEGLLGGGFFATGANQFDRASSPGNFLALAAFWSALALLPLGLAFGFALPAALRAAYETPDRIGENLGKIYLWNTLGAAAGAGLCVFVLIPAMGSRASLAFFAFASLLAGSLVAFRNGTFAKTPARVLLGVFLALLSFQFLISPRNASSILFAREGASTSVIVEEAGVPGGAMRRQIRIGGRIEASTALLDLRLQRLLGHLPVLLHPDAKSVAVIGLGTGITAGSSASHKSVEHLRIIEISPEVEAGSRLFYEHSRLDALAREKKIEIDFEDGRNFLLGSEERFDVITADPVHPWTAGAGNLFTLEHFQRARAHLNPGGLVGQWVPLYQLSPADVKTILASFAAAFPQTQIWLTGYDLVLIGSERALEIDEAALRARFQESALRLDFEAIGISSAEDLLALYLGGNDFVRILTEGAALNHDLDGRIEFSAPRSIWMGYPLAFFEEILSRGGAGTPIPISPASALAVEEARREMRGALEAFLSPLRGEQPDYPRAFDALTQALQTRANNR